MPSTDLVYRFLGLDAGAGVQFDRMAGKTAALGKSSDAALASVKRFAIGAGILATVVGVEGVKAATNFQTQLTRIHTQADATNSQVGRLRKGILDMAGAVATSPTLLAQAAFHIASVGQNSLSTAQQLRILKIAAEGAKLGGADLVDVTNALDAAVVSGIRGVKNYSQAMGVLNATVGAGDMTMQNLAEAFGPLGAVLKGYNVDIRQAGAALATFGDNNLRGAEAGTALRMAVQALAVPVKAGQEQLKAWGIHSGSLAKQLTHGGLTDALDTLYGLLKKNGVTSKDVGTVLTQTFGKRAGIGLSMLIGELTRYHNKLAEVSKGSHSFASSWKGYTKTFQYAWDQMRQSVQKMAIQLGTVLLPAATAVAKFVTNHVVPALSSVGHFLKDNASWVKPLAVALAGAAIAYKAFTVATRLATIAMGLFDAAADANPIGLIVTAIGAAVAAFIYFWKTSEKFRSVVKTVFVDLAKIVGWWAQMNLKMLKFVADGMLSFISATIHTAASAFGWLPFGIGKGLKSAASKFDSFKSDVDGTLTKLANDAGNLGSYAGGLFGSNFVSRAEQFTSAAKFYIKGSGLKGTLGPALGQGKTTPTIPTLSLSGGTGGPLSTPSTGSAASSAANVLHVTAKKLTDALSKGLLHGWTGFAQTVEDSLSVGTRHLLDALGKQFQTITDRMNKLVADAKSKLHDALQSQRQFVQQMLGDASLSNVPTTDSGYLQNGGQQLTSIGAFLAREAASYAQFNRALRRLAHMGLGKGLLNQIASMGPTQGLQYAQQILSGQAGSIAQLNAYQKQIAGSAQAIGQDRYGAQIRTDRKHLQHMVAEQRRTNQHLEHLAHKIGVEVRQELGPLLAKGLTGKQVGLSPHEAKLLDRDLKRLNRQLGKG